MTKNWAGRLLGDSEKTIMVIMWEMESATIRDIYERLRLNRSIAYTTVMTVMNRLCDKGLLKKDSDGTAFVYSCTISKKEFVYMIVSEIMNELGNESSDETVSYLVERLEKLRVETKVS